MINKNRIGTECKIECQKIETINFKYSISRSTPMTQTVTEKAKAILVDIVDSNSCLVRFFETDMNGNQKEKIVENSKISFPCSTILYTATLKHTEERVDEYYNTYSDTQEFELISNKREGNNFSDDKLISECKKVKFISDYIEKYNTDIKIDHAHAGWKNLSLLDNDDYFIDYIVINESKVIENFEY
jgi:hypothetical protein